MRIQHNIMAMSAYRNYTNNVAAMKKNLEKLSSGYKINRAGDDAAGLAISEKMRAQITGLETAQKNAKDGISLVQTAEGALTEVHDMLNRMVELATQSANGTYDNTTDRAQMQKEVNQLLSEIDRIADSSNFNGINLLDGTLGLNTEAFEIGATLDAKQAAAADTVALTGSKFHGGVTKNAIKPEFTVDLANLAVKGSAAGGVITINIGDASITLTGIASTANLTASQIATQLRTKYDGSTASKSIELTSGAYFKVSGTGTELTFKYAAGETTGGTFMADANGTLISTSIADAVNSWIAGADVSVSTSKCNVNAGTDLHHALEKVTNAQAKENGVKAGVSFDISELVKDGYELNIDGTTFTFAVGSGATGTGNTIAIDTNKFTDTNAQIAEAVRQLSGKTTTNFHIGAESGGANGVIHIDQLAADTRSFANTDAIMAVVSANKGNATAATGKGVEVTVKDSAKIRDGNTLSVDGKKYVFTTDTSKIKTTYGSDEPRYIAVSAGVDGLKAALEADGYTVEEAVDSNGAPVASAPATKLNIYAGAAATAAPQVLGKGLTLQIGDTSDPWNQLNVAVQDMHAESLGVGGLSIATEEDAQAAIDKIKAAINTVSDVRGTLGATQNRLDHTINNLSVMTENIQDAESTIRDVDVAEEMMAYTKNNILIQSAQAMLAQANQVPQGVLQLLQ